MRKVYVFYPLFPFLGESGMKLIEMHFLRTHQCTLECDYYFIWATPSTLGQRYAKGLMDSNLRFFLNE